MKKIFFMFVVLLAGCSCNRTQEISMNQKWFYDPITDMSLEHLFPATVAEINMRTELLKREITNSVAHIISIADEQKTFANTVQAFDTLGKYAQRVASPLNALSELSTSKEIRDVARDSVLKLAAFLQKEVAKNVDLYKAFKKYADTGAVREELSEEQRYYITETVRAFERNGLLLPPDKLDQVRKISDELEELEQQFSKILNDIDTQLPFATQELVGVPEAVLKSLKKNASGNYLVGLDYPTVFAVMKHAKVESTRKQVFQAFANRGYPENYSILQQMIIKRDQLAKILNFGTYTSYDLEDQMAKSPEIVTKFIDELALKARKKAAHEAHELLALPEAVGNPDNKIAPWNLSYLKEIYRNKFFNIDSAKIAEYFPVDAVVAKILELYSSFLGLRFEPFVVSGLWHDSVKLLKVFDENNILRGYLLLDLYPRPNKFGHACLMSVVSGVISQEKYEPAVAIMVANFSPGNVDEPGLLTFDEVQTFFHEFGHCMHLITGATKLFGFSGTHTKRDFVEVPSQMFEEWLYDPQVLKKLARHYKTGELLPDNIIKQLGALVRFDIGDFVERQVALSHFSMDLFMGPDQDIQKTYRDLMIAACPYIIFDNNSHLPANFNHIASSGYGPKYYGYLWSKVFALDLFVTLKKRGLFDAQVGKDLVDKVLSKGGSIEPDKLLQDFLGRPSDQRAFLSYYGL